MKLKPLRLLKFLSGVVVLITIINIACFLSYCSVTKGMYAKKHHSKIIQFSKFPYKVIEVAYHLLKGIPPTYKAIDPSFKEINLLEKNLFALNSFWNLDQERWDVRLINLRDDSLVHEWFFEKNRVADIKTNIQFENLALRCHFIKEEQSLIIVAGKIPGLWKLDLQSNVIWSNHDLIFHHSVNLDNDNNIWACASALPIIQEEGNIGRVVVNVQNEKIPYIEDYIVLVDGKTGAINYKKGVSGILIENQFKSFVYGQDMVDPMHLNDVEPVLRTTEYWNEGDVFISLRHASLVFLYRPSNNKILKLLYGPFLNQHDVDIVSPGVVSIFNNNCILTESRAIFRADYKEDYNTLPIDSLVSSEIVIYNFERDSFSTIYKKQFQEERIYTISEGLHQELSNGDTFVESQNSGKLYIMNEEGFVYKKQMQSPLDGFAYRPSWIKIYEENPLIKK